MNSNMHNIKQLLKLLPAVLTAIMTVACNNDEWQEVTAQPSPEGETVHTARLIINGGLTSFDSQDATTTRSATASPWPDNAQVYLQFFNASNQRVRGVAIYNSRSGEWAVTYSGTLPSDEEAKCEAYYFENPTSANSTTVTLSPHSTAYADQAGKYIVTDGIVTVSAELTPMTGRLRFKGAAGNSVVCAGLKAYTGYSITGNSFEEDVVNQSLTIANNGFTPYVYAAFADGAQRQLTVDYDKDKYYRKTFSSRVLSPGLSGYVELPSASAALGWMPLPKVETYTVNGVSFNMVRVLPGSFDMGSTQNDGEKPIHHVTLTKEYFIGETEVTQALWKAVMNGSNPSSSTGDNKPVENVSWNNCQTFITSLNSLTGATFRLPSEAEWEFAARGGRYSKGYLYSGSNTIGDVAWYYGNTSNATHAVKTKQANELGIYDMSGNVREWCQDWYGSYASGAATDPKGASSGSYRVVRGGCYGINAEYCRVAYRGYYAPTSTYGSLGFRLASQ